MVSKRTLIVGTMVLFVLAGGVPRSESQSVFPVRFETPEPTNPASKTSSGGLAIETATHYSKSFTLDVGAGSAENILDITAPLDDTTVMVRLLAASRQSNSSNSGSAREVVGLAIFDTSSTPLWASIQNYPVFSSGATIGIAFNVAGPGPIELTVTTPANHDLLTLTIEVVANKDVTFFEHF